MKMYMQSGLCLRNRVFYMAQWFFILITALSSVSVFLLLQGVIKVKVDAKNIFNLYTENVSSL